MKPTGEVSVVRNMDVSGSKHLVTKGRMFTVWGGVKYWIKKAAPTFSMNKWKHQSGHFINCIFFAKTF